MRTSLTLSASLHLIVLAVVLINFTWGGRKNPPPQQQPVAIEILSPSDVSRVKAGSPDKPEKPDVAAAQAKPEPIEKKAETPPAAPDPEPARQPVEKPAKKPAALPPPPKPQAARRGTAPIPAKSYTQGQDRPAPQEDAPPESRERPRRPPAPLPLRRPEPDPDEDREADARHRRPPPRAAAPDRDSPRQLSERERDNDRIADLLDRPEPEPRRATRFDPNRIAALLNRDPDAGDEPREQRPREPWRRPSSFEDQAAGITSEPRERASYGQPTGRDDRMSASEIDAFIAQVSRCWTPPVGGIGAESIVVKLHIELREDGRLAKPPQVANSGSSPFFTPAADSAVRAVLQCEPYRMPPGKFSHWRDMLLNFDPRQMYGG